MCILDDFFPLIRYENKMFFPVISRLEIIFEYISATEEKLIEVWNDSE